MFFIMLDFALGSGWVVCNLLLDNNLYFCDFRLYLKFNIILDCIEVYLDFNQNYNSFFAIDEKNYIYFLIKWASEPTRLTHQLVVGRVGFKFFWLANKWAGLDWLTKWPTRGGSSWVTRFDISKYNILNITTHIPTTPLPPSPHENTTKNFDTFTIWNNYLCTHLEPLFVVFSYCFFFF